MPTIEFWNLARVLQVTGLSKSVIYSQMREGRFPKNRSYRDQPRRRFWLSSEVEAWQQAQLETDAAIFTPAPLNEFDALLRDR